MKKQIIEFRQDKDYKLNYRLKLLVEFNESGKNLEEMADNLTKRDFNITALKAIL